MLVALVPDRTDARRIHNALSPVLPIEWCQRAEDLVHSVERAQVILTTPLDENGTSVSSAISRLRERAPHIPIIAYVALIPETVRALAQLGENTIFTVVIRGIDDTRACLRRIMDSAVAHTCEQHLWNSVMPSVPADVHSIVEYCIEHSRTALTVAHVSRALQLPERTMNADLRRAGLVSAQELIAWCRLVRVSCLLHNESLTLDALAIRLDFPSTAALHALVSRLTGLTPGALRQAGATARTVVALQQRVRRTA